MPQALRPVLYLCTSHLRGWGTGHILPEKVKSKPFDITKIAKKTPLWFQTLLIKPTSWVGLLVPGDDFLLLCSPIPLYKCETWVRIQGKPRKLKHLHINLLQQDNTHLTSSDWKMYLKGNSRVKMNLFWLIVLFPVFAILIIFCSESLLQLRYRT